MNFKKTALELWQYLKKNLPIFILLIMAVFLLFKDGVKNVETAKIQSDTSRTITYITQPTVHSNNYTPIEIRDTTRVIIPAQYQPNTEDIKILQKQVSELGEKLFRTNRVKDTIYLKDTSGLELGNVSIEDSIRENSILSRKYNYSLKFPQTTVTVTNTIIPPKKREFFLGPEASSSTTKFLEFGGALLYKDRKDNIIRFSSGLQLTSPMGPYVSLGYYPKIF